MLNQNALFLILVGAFLFTGNEATAPNQFEMQSSGYKEETRDETSR